MDMTVIILIALRLSMDAFAVSISSGLTIKNLKINNTFIIAASFGLFQAVMPLLGWLAGRSLRNLITEIDHWVAFFLLSFIGCKMIYESFRLDPSRKKIDPTNLYVLLILSVATSIDALAIGISLAFLKIFIITPIIIIGAVTFSLSFAGVYVGNRFGLFSEKKLKL
jgi:putative Mn2+ efflux pump MntP